MRSWLILLLLMAWPLASAAEQDADDAHAVRLPGNLEIKPEGGAVAMPYPSAPGMVEVDSVLAGLRLSTGVNEPVRMFGTVGGLHAEDESGSTWWLLSQPVDDVGWYWSVGVELEARPLARVGLQFVRYDVDLMRVDSYQMSIRFDL